MKKEVGRGTPVELCQACGEPLKRVRVVYGYPTTETFDRAERGEVVLGGCGVTGDDPKYACRNCRELLSGPRTGDAPQFASSND